MESGGTSDAGVDLALPDRVICQGPSHAPPVAALRGHCHGVRLVWSPAGVCLAEEARLPPGPQTQSSLHPGLSAAQLGSAAGSLHAAVTSLRLAWGVWPYSVRGPLTLGHPGPPLPCPAAPWADVASPRLAVQLGPKRFPEFERAAGAKAHHALGSCLDPRPAFLSRPKPRWRNKLRPALLTPGVPSPPLPLLSYVRPISPLSSGHGPRGWGSRGASSVPVREPRAAENPRKSLLQARPWLSRPAL